MAKISIQRRFDLIPPCKDRSPEFLQIGAASGDAWWIVAQKSGALCREDSIEFFDRIADRDGVHDRPQYLQ